MNKKTAPKRNDIQILRAIAVISVVIFHINEEYLPSGFLGVDIFFVISGFLMAKIIISSNEKQEFSLLNFYLNRGKRILPAYSLMLIVSLVIGAFLFLPKDFSYLNGSFISAIKIQSNHFFASFGSYFAPSLHQMPLLHTWSLSIELQFYLFIPLTLLVFRSLNHYLFLSIILIISLYISYQLYINKAVDESYFSFFGRIPEFLVGSWLFLYTHKSKTSGNKYHLTLGIGLLILGFLIIDSSSYFPGLLALIPCVGIAMIIYSQKLNSIPILNSKATIFLGDISYSLYLWHWPVLAFVRYYYDGYNIPTISLVLSLLIILILSVISYYLIESNFKSKQNKPLKILSACILFIFISIPITNRLNPAYTLELKEPLIRYAPPNTICHSQILENCNTLIDFKNSGEKFQAMIIGDSHGAHLYRFSQLISNNLKVKIKLITASSCPAIPNMNTSYLKNSIQKNCKIQIEEVKRNLNDIDLLILAGKWSFHLNHPEFSESLDKFLKSYPGKVLILSQVPLINSNIRKYQRHSKLGINRSLLIDPSYIKANSAIEKISSKYINVFFIDLTHLPVFRKAPLFNDIPTHFDSHHLNEYGSKIYGEQSLEYLKEHFNYK